MISINKGGFILVEKVLEGNIAPDFKLKASNGKEISLSDFLGKNIVLYFYPKDNTPG